MSLRTRLVLLTMAIVAAVALAFSVLYLDTLVNKLSADALDRSVRAGQEVSSFLIEYIRLHATTEYPEFSRVASPQEVVYKIVSDDRDVSNRLINLVALSPYIVEINLAGQDDQILASSDERRVGTKLIPWRDFTQWTQRPVISRMRDLMIRRPNYQVSVPLGLQGPHGQPESVMTIQVVSSAALLLNDKDVLSQVRWLAVISTGSLLAAVLITLMAASLVLRPLKRLDQAIDRIVQGNYGGELAAQRAPKEFAVLESKLNLLGQQFRGARENATELRHDVDQLLERMASQLDVASRLASISRLTGGVAHEIKNPLNAIALRLDFLREKLGAPEEELKQDIDVLSKEIARLDRVVKTFLDFSRPVEVHFEDVDIVALTREVADLMVAPARLSHIDIQVDAPEEPVIMRGDADMIKQALLNLVTNAIEAMSSGGQIRLVVARDNDGHVSLEVSDTGPGIPDSQRDRVFQLYFTTKGRGSGIGLALTYRAVQLHNGTIGFNTEEGRGTTFSLQFPAAIRHV